MTKFVCLVSGLICYSIITVITPKFEQPDYSVPEDEGPVEVCVVVEEGDELERDAVVVIQTEDNTATGTYRSLKMFLHTLRIGAM